MDENAGARRLEAELLALVGQSLFAQDLRVRVQLSSALAAGALAAWKREDTDHTLDESRTERAIRQRAGALALIGLTVDEVASAAGDEVEVELHAWQIGAALDAAEEAGLLTDLS